MAMTPLLNTAEGSSTTTSASSTTGRETSVKDRATTTASSPPSSRRKTSPILIAKKRHHHRDVYPTKQHRPTSFSYHPTHKPPILTQPPYPSCAAAVASSSSSPPLSAIASFLWQLKRSTAAASIEIVQDNPRLERQPNATIVGVLWNNNNSNLEDKRNVRWDPTTYHKNSNSSINDLPALDNSSSSLNADEDSSNNNNHNLMYHPPNGHATMSSSPVCPTRRQSVDDISRGPPSNENETSTTAQDYRQELERLRSQIRRQEAKLKSVVQQQQQQQQRCTDTSPKNNVDDNDDDDSYDDDMDYEDNEEEEEDNTTTSCTTDDDEYNLEAIQQTTQYHHQQPLGRGGMGDTGLPARPTRRSSSILSVVLDPKVLEDLLEEDDEDNDDDDDSDLDETDDRRHSLDQGATSATGRAPRQQRQYRHELTCDGPHGRRQQRNSSFGSCSTTSTSCTVPSSPFSPASSISSFTIPSTNMIHNMHNNHNSSNNNNNTTSDSMGAMLDLPDYKLALNAVAQRYATTSTSSSPNCSHDPSSSTHHAARARPLSTAGSNYDMPVVIPRRRESVEVNYGGGSTSSTLATLDEASLLVEVSSATASSPTSSSS